MTRPAIYPPAPGDDDVIAEVHDACGTAPCTCPGSFLSESETCKRCGQSSRMPGTSYCEWCWHERGKLGTAAKTLRRYARHCRDQITTGELFRLANELDGEVS